MVIMSGNVDSKIDLIITSRARDLGGFSVRRLLPYATHRMVGPFIFFDHLGPAQFPPGEGISVRPHPHINLATVTYLFEGRILHRDSLGSNQIIEPGAVNWMTAGRGIVHSERATDEDKYSGTKLNGIQLWVALPEEHEEAAPSFIHHPKNTLPEFEWRGAQIKLLLGNFLERKSPVVIHSDLFYADVKFQKHGSFALPAEERETAFYVVEGQVQIDGQKIDPYTMIIAKAGIDLQFEAQEGTHLMVLGGKPVGPRHIYWNFVSSSRARIDEAKKDWLKGPRSDNLRFHTIPGDDKEFIPLPQE